MDAFATQFEKTIKSLFGEVPIPKEMSFDVSSKRSDRMQCYVFQIRVTYLFLHSEGVEKKLLTLQHAVSDFLLSSLQRTSQKDLLDSVIKKCFFEKAYLFYPWDPRYGWSMRDAHDELPRSPLFDPPLLISRNGLMIEGYPPLNCPFCKEQISNTYPPVWGGGNLMWVHDNCLPQIKLNETNKLFVD